MIRGRRAKYLVLTVALFGAALSAGSTFAASLPGGGCTVTGDVDGYPPYNGCSYTARTGTQTMIVGSANYWRAYVERQVLGPTYCWDEATHSYDIPCQGYTLQQIVLGNGYGNLLDGSGAPRQPGLIQIHPNPGEQVNLELYGDCYPGAPTTCGKVGILSAYE